MFLRRIKNVQCSTLKCKERKHGTFFLRVYKLTYISCILRPTKGQQEKEMGGATFGREGANDRCVVGERDKGQYPPFTRLLPRQYAGLCLLSRPQSPPPAGWYDDLSSFFSTPQPSMFYLPRSQYFPSRSRIRRSWSALPSLTPANPWCLAVPAVCPLLLWPWSLSYSQLTHTPRPLHPRTAGGPPAPPHTDTHPFIILEDCPHAGSLPVDKV